MEELIKVEKSVSFFNCGRCGHYLNQSNMQYKDRTFQYIIGDEMIIHDLYIEPEYRRQGHAKNILKRIIREIRSTGWYGEILVRAEPYQNSISRDDLVAFYKSVGLTVID